METEEELSSCRGGDIGVKCKVLKTNIDCVFSINVLGSCIFLSCPFRGSFCYLQILCFVAADFRIGTDVLHASVRGM